VYVALSNGFSFGAGVKWHDYFSLNGEVPSVGDVNGDGLDDIITFTRNAAADVFVALSTGSAFAGTEQKWNDFFGIAGDVPLVGDFNGDGVDDLATFTRAGTAEVRVALSTGLSFVDDGTIWHDFFAVDHETPVVGDFNGDGKDDIATFTRGSTGDVFVALSNGGQFIGVGILWHGFFAPGNAIPMTADVNADNKDDIVYFTRGSTGDVFVALSTGAAFGAAVKWHDSFDFAAEVPAVGDVNGDNRDDIVAFSRGSTGDVFVALSTGAAFGGAVKWHDVFGFDDEVVGVGNFSGDTRDDVVVFTRGSAADVFVATSTGASFTGTGVLWHGAFGNNSRISLPGSLW
jgi:hypothetical protein